MQAIKILPGTCLFLRDVVVMRFIPPPNSSWSFEVSAFFGMVILMTFVATLHIYGIASRNVTSISIVSPTSRVCTVLLQLCDVTQPLHCIIIWYLQFSLITTVTDAVNEKCGDYSVQYEAVLQNLPSF